MVHPSDSASWKVFDIRYLNFASEHMIVRLGLCSNGFSPFGMSPKNYSYWSIMVTPGCVWRRALCSSRLSSSDHIVLKKWIDIYWRPLINDLKVLWEVSIYLTLIASKRTTNLLKRKLHDLARGKFFVPEDCFEVYLSAAILDQPCFWMTLG